MNSQDLAAPLVSTWGVPYPQMSDALKPEDLRRLICTVSELK